MGISHQTSVSLLVGLCMAGCASKPSTSSNAPVISDELPAATPAKPTAPALAPDDEANRQRVVVDTVGDTVDRFDQIIRQREQAKQNAADLRETRAAVAAASPKDPAAKDPVADNDPATIEKLSAALREHKTIDPVPEASPPLAGKAASNAAVAATDDVTAVTPGANGKTDPTASGSIASGARVQMSRNGEPTPDVTRGDPAIDSEQTYVSRVAKDPRDLSAQLDLQMVRFLKDEPVPAMDDMAALPTEDRELISAVCDALSNFRSVVRSDPNPLNSTKARPFIDMAERIRTRADLTLSGLTLCTKVDAFGVYDKIDPLTFSAGEPKRCVIYCEVDGFLSQLNSEQMWETKLSLEVRIYDEHGLQVWSLPPNETKDASNRRRRDFFLGKVVQLPTNLVPGNFMLKATVRDLQANRVAQQTIQFTVKAKE